MKLPTAVYVRPLVALTFTAFLAACGGGGGSGSPLDPAPTPTPTPTPTNACGTMKALTLNDLQPYAGDYSVKIFEDPGNGNAVEVGTAKLTLAGTQVTLTPDAGMTGSTAKTDSVVAVCENTLVATGAKIGVVAMFAAKGYYGSSMALDFNDASGATPMTVSGDDIGNSTNPAKYRYVSGEFGTGTPTPTPTGLANYSEFFAAAPRTNTTGATAASVAWAVGTYYGRGNTDVCTLTVAADGKLTGTLAGATQSATLDGGDKSRWFAMTSGQFGFSAVNGTELVDVLGMGGHLTQFMLSATGVVGDVCKILFKSTNPIDTAANASAPFPIKNAGFVAADLPGWMVGNRQGVSTGNPFFVRTTIEACSLDIGADGVLTLSAAGETYTAKLDGESNDEGNDQGATFSGLPDPGFNTVYSILAQQVEGSLTSRVRVQVSHTAGKTQIDYAEGSSGGTELMPTNFRNCYFPN